MPTTFDESDLKFIFSNDWVVYQYDQHPFYKALAGRGLKGVDFVGVLNGEDVILIEVKNYKIRFPSRYPPIYGKITGKKPRIVKTMVSKLAGTHRALNAINTYYQRRWWYSFANKVLKHFPHRILLKVEWYFWTFVAQKVGEGDFHLVLWLELEKEYKTMSALEIQHTHKRILGQMKNELNQKVQHLHVSNHLQHDFHQSLLVRLISSE